MHKPLLILLLLITFLQAEANKTYFTWIYNKDKTCAIYDEVVDSKNKEIYWTGDCVNKKANGYGIAIFTDIKEGKRNVFFQYEGFVKDGKFNGAAYIIWPNSGTSGSPYYLDGKYKEMSKAYFHSTKHEIIYADTYDNNNSIIKREKYTQDTKNYKQLKKIAYSH